MFGCVMLCSGLHCSIPPNMPMILAHDLLSKPAKRQVPPTMPKESFRPRPGIFPHKAGSETWQLGMAWGQGLLSPAAQCKQVPLWEVPVVSRWTRGQLKLSGLNRHIAPQIFRGYRALGRVRTSMAAFRYFHIHWV